MKTGPLNESELEWLDDVLTKYNTDKAILDVSELKLNQSSGWSQFGAARSMSLAGPPKKK